MAHNLQYRQSLQNTRLDDIVTALGATGKLRIYTGSQPAGPDTALGAQVMISEHALSNPAAPGASGGVLTFDTIDPATAAATGTAAWFTLVDGSNARIVDGSVGLMTADLILDNLSINLGQTVNINSLEITAGN